jgi:hypothetical protein
MVLELQSPDKSTSHKGKGSEDKMNLWVLNLLRDGFGFLIARQIGLPQGGLFCKCSD